MVKLNGPSRPKTADGKGKRDTYEKAYTLYEGRELILYVFISGIFPLKERHRRLKILTPKQMLQRSPIAIAQVKASNTSEKLTKRNQTNHTFFASSKRNYQKVYNNIMNSKRYNTKMNTIFVNSGNGKTSDPHRLLLNFKDKISLRRKDKYISLSNLSIYYIWKKS